MEAQNGATLDMLASSIIDDEITIDDAIEFINIIIDSQVQFCSSLSVYVVMQILSIPAFDRTPIAELLT